STPWWLPCASFARAWSWSSSRTTSESASSRNSGTEAGSHGRRRAFQSPPVALVRVWRNQADAPVSETGLWGFDSLRPHLASVAQRTQSTGLRPRAQRSESSRGLSQQRDTVAERRGARLQSALRRFDSARCLSASQ